MRGPHSRKWFGVSVGVVALVAAACGSSTASGSSGNGSSSGSSKSPITIGFISSQTGDFSSSYVNAQWGAQARIDAQNAEGGVNGHKLKLVTEDDGSVPANNKTAAQDLVENKNVFGVIEDSALTFSAAPYLTQQGVPVTGAAIDGPEWGESQSTNMFSVTVPFPTPIHGVYYAYSDEANFLKDIGITKFAGLTYDLQSAQQSLSSTLQILASKGISTCYDNTTYGFGATDFTAAALSIKSSGCNGASFVGLLANCIALSSALKNAGAQAKTLCLTGYDQNLLDNASALHSMEGDYTSATVDIEHPNSAAKLMLNRLKQYTGYTGGIPNLNIIFGYAAADLMIKGLELAGANPTRQAFISNLRKVSNYTVDGLFAGAPVTFQHLGTEGMFPKTACQLFEKITANGYVPYNNGKPVCGVRTATHQ